MKFISTRGQRPPPVPFRRFFWPAWRRMAGSTCRKAGRNSPPPEIAAFKGMRYQDVAVRILSHFTRGCFSDAEVRDAVEAAYAGFDAPAIAPLVEIGAGRYLLELFPRPHAGLQGHRAAGPGAVVQPRADQARRPRHHRRRHLRRHRLRRHRGAGRAAQHRRLCDASQGPGQRGAAPADDHQRPCQCPQYCAGRQLRRRPGHRESPVRR